MSTKRRGPGPFFPVPVVDVAGGGVGGVAVVLAVNHRQRSSAWSQEGQVLATDKNNSGVSGRIPKESKCVKSKTKYSEYIIVTGAHRAPKRQENKRSAWNQRTNASDCNQLIASIFWRTFVYLSVSQAVESLERAVSRGFVYQYLL